MSKEKKQWQEVARLKMPMSMLALGRLLTCFSEEFEGSVVKQDGDYMIVYVDVTEVL